MFLIDSRLLLLQQLTQFKLLNESHLITSINPIIGMAWEGFKFGYSYDFNLSKIGGDGGISEFSITYDFLNNKDCFGCPEY